MEPQPNMGTMLVPNMDTAHVKSGMPILGACIIFMLRCTWYFSFDVA